jgi:hypothetical protein
LPGARVLFSLSAEKPEPAQIVAVTDAAKSSSESTPGAKVPDRSILEATLAAIKVAAIRV